VVAGDDTEGPAAADFLADRLHAHAVAIVAEDEAGYRGLADRVRAKLSDRQITVRVLYSRLDASSLNSIINKLVQDHVDAVYVASSAATAGKLRGELRTAGLNPQFLAHGNTMDPAFLTAAGAAADGAFLTCTCAAAASADLSLNDHIDVPTQVFSSAYASRFHTQPGPLSAEAYDAANALLAALSPTTPSVVLATLNDTVFNGASKRIQFQRTGDLSGVGIFIAEVCHRQFVPIGDYFYAKPLPDCSAGRQEG
jgi:branched-chain amino acid transport system substrate-binding protein